MDEHDMHALIIATGKVHHAKDRCCIGWVPHSQG